MLQKMKRAFCPKRVVEFNPVIDICKYIIFREKKIFTISRATKFGGNIEFSTFSDLSKAFLKGSLHPQDLKNAVAMHLADILEPVRRYFTNNKEAMKCLDIIKEAKITR